jgi:ATP-dependent Clp protease ATP-binding subunit ClpB
VQDPLAELILAGEIRDGETVPVHAGPTGLMIGDGVGRPSHEIAA